MVPFAINPGETFSKHIQWLAGSLPVNVAGMAFAFELRDVLGAVVASYTDTPNIVASTGSIDLWIEDAVTPTVEAATTYRLKVTYANGDTKFLLEGSVLKGLHHRLTDGVVIIEDEVVRIEQIGIQGPGGPAGDDIDANFTLLYQIAKL